MPAGSVTFTALPGLPMVKAGDDLAPMILSALARADQKLAAGDVLVVAQKIISKAQGRLIKLGNVVPSPAAEALAKSTGKDPRLVELALGESTEVVRAAPNVLILRHRLGHVMANAGIDQSNIEHDGGPAALLLPVDPDGTARALRSEIGHITGIAPAVIINDSFGRPWRLGVTGVALGVAGLAACVSRVGYPDLFGRSLQMTEIAVADEIAAAASLLMGQSAEGTPVVHIRGLTLSDDDGRGAQSRLRPTTQDLFR